MPKRRVIIISLVLIIVVIFIVFFISIQHQKQNFSKLKGKEDFNYILVTVDTLRADRIGCYGFTQIETPFIDLFALRGVKFERCIAQTPLTLPSHTSLLTGTQPTFHGVRDNGGFIVSKELTTFAELFRKKNYRTAAFVGAYVLDSQWGLDQGFDTYFDKFDLARYATISLADVQRRADIVIDEFLSWIEKNKEHKFFSWVHLYDPHTPYDPPSPFKEKYPQRPYEGEIAFTDHQIGRLWQYLEKNNLVEKTILIFTSDHGESLGEHQEATHGFFIYEEAIHVPLIFVLPFEKLQNLDRSKIVSLVDIMPTVLEMEEIPIPSQVQGKSLLPLFFKDKKAENNFAYIETYYPRFHYGWSELKGIRNERFKLIISPTIELYDLINDPDEANNLAFTNKQELKKLKILVEEYIKETSHDAFQLDYRHVDEETRRKLAALGYVGTYTDSDQLTGKELASPKDKIGVFNRLSEAREIGLAGESQKAKNMIEEIINEDSDIIDAYLTLGNLYYNEDKFEEAIKYFSIILDKRPDDKIAIINMASSYLNLGKLKEAERIILDSTEVVSPDSQLYLILGHINKLQEEYGDAINYYKKCLTLNPYSSSAFNELGLIYFIQDNLEVAERNLMKSISLNPKLKNVHYNYAQVLEKKGDLITAIEEYKKELNNSPKNFVSSYNLSVIYRKLNDVEKEENYLKKTIEIKPNFPLGYFYLARIFLHQERDYREAIELVKKGISLKPERQYLPFGYFLLADLYNRIGNNSRSLKYAKIGKEIQNSISTKK